LDRKLFKGLKRKVTLLTLTTSGRVFTIELSVWKMYLIGLIIVLLVIAYVVWVSVKFSQIVSQRDSIARQYAELQESLAKMKQSIEPLTGYRDTINALIGVGSAPRPGTRDMLSLDSEKGALGDTAAKETAQVDRQKVKVTVEKLSVKWRRIARGRWRLLFSFNLVNSSSGGKRASGYLFVVASISRIGPGSARSYPRAPLDGLVPSRPERGSSFSISRWKPVKGFINLPIGSEPFDELSIYVFGRDGGLIYHSTMGIEPPA